VSGVGSPILNFNPEGDDLKRNQRAVGLYLSDMHLRDLSPQSFGLNGATRGFEPNRHDYIAFADGVSQQIYTTLPRPQQWIDGNVRLDLWYSGDATVAASNVRLQAILTRYKAGDLSPGIGEGQLVSNQTVPAPTTAKTVLQFSWPVYLPIVQDSSLLAVVLTRVGADAADTYTGAFWLLAARLTYLPARRSA